LDKTVSTKSSMQCIVALVWIVIMSAGCAERESTGSAKQQSEDTTVRPAETPAIRSNGEVEPAGATIGALKYSDGCRTPTSTPGVHYLSLEHGGWERDYIMTVPDSATRQSLAHPLLIAMHGFGGSGAGMRSMIGSYNGFEDGYVVLYPDGAGSTNGTRGWNSGHPQCCGTALHKNVDDVAFLRALVEAVAQETCIDLNRVYATGFSNGGDMAQRLACDASDVMAAVTSVAGRFDYHSSVCPGDRPVPAVLYRGQLDRTVPYESNLLSLVAFKTIPAVEGFRRIARNHECRGNPFNTFSAEDTDCIRMDDCDAGFEIILCTSAGAGHCWPGIGGCSSSRQGGAVAFSASDHMQEFFARHAQSP
jgi:polyhydroxybutyrate depolymerase